MVTVIFGDVTPSPTHIDRRTLLEMRSPEGNAPCADGLRQALKLVRDRNILIDDAQVEGSEATLDVAWAEDALGLSGYGYGDGYGYGYGSGDGSGYERNE